MKLDVYNSERLYNNWKKHVETNGMDDLSKKNSDLIKKYIFDMELGRNIAKGSKKGARSFIRLNTLRNKLSLIIRHLENNGFADVTKLEEEDITIFFKEFKNGRKSIADHVKDFKAFWHWLIKIKKQEGIVIEDITEYLDTSKEENNFVYFTFPQLEKMMKLCPQDVQVRMLFMFETIIRSPTELMNVMISDFSPEFKELKIRGETSKTFERTIKINKCSNELKDYVERNDLKDGDYLFTFSAPVFNKQLQRLAKHLFGEKMTKGGKKYSQLTMYDFRHSGACYWRLGAYNKKIDALMYRGGWSDLKMLNYYTKKLGMKDSITEEDLIDVDKNKLERKIDLIEKDKQMTGKVTRLLLDKELGIINKKDFISGINLLLSGEIGK